MAPPASRHIGIVACSAEGAALCYRTICAEAPRVMGEHCHPEVTMHTHPLSQYMARFTKGDWRGVASLMLSSARVLARAGAAFAICPDNTIHQAFGLVVGESPIPWIHIADPIVGEARERGFRRVGVMGTQWLMEGPVYPEALGPHGIATVVPESADRERINAIIFEELVNGVFLDRSRAYFREVIARLQGAGCDAVILACTEIPLLVGPEDSPLPALDSTRLLARAAIARALETG